jgi:hypothetical protein
MDFAVDGLVNIFGDNQSVILNTTIPSTEKEDLCMCLPSDWEMITCRAIRFFHCQSTLIAADVLTKPFNGIRHRKLTEPILCGDGVHTSFTD